GQEGMMDVDRGRRHPVEGLGREDLHVAREDDEVDARQQLEQLRLGRRLVSRRQLVKRQPERRYALAQVGVVRDDERRAALELALLEPPQEVEQAVAVA